MHAALFLGSVDSPFNSFASTRADDCVTRRKLSTLNNSQDSKQQSPWQTTTGRSSAELMKPNQTKLNQTRYTLAKDTITLHIAIPQAASIQRTHVAHTQGRSRMHPVNSRAAT